MALSDQLILETRQAFRELDALQGRLDRLSDVRLDVNLDTSNLNADIERSQQLARETAGAFGEIREQVVLTTSEYRQAVQLVEQGESAARAVAIATGDVTVQASNVEDAFRRIAANMDLSEDEARDLAQSMGRSTIEATQLDADLRQVALSMGLSDEEARRFAASTRSAATNTGAATTAAESLAVVWQRVRTLIVTAVAAFGVRGLVRQFDQAIDSTLALSESVNAVNVIFEEGADTVLNFAQTAADAAGLATSEAQQLVVPIGALLRNFGFDAQAAGDAAVTLTQRAADLASVFNTDVSEALGAIQAALRGEADPLERFGASISAARVEAFALSEGLAASKAELTDSIRLQARYQLILADTAKSAGDFANTSDEAANQQRTLAADVENARAKLGDALLPAFQAIIAVAPRFLFDVAAMSESIREMAGSAEDAEGPVLTLADTIAGIPRGFGVLSDIATVPAELFGSVAQLGSALVGAEGGAAGIDAAIDDLIGTFDDFFDSLQQRAILESFIADLKDGVDPALAFANAAAATARNNELTLDSFLALARISGASDDRLRDATITMLETGEAAGFSAEEIKVLQIALGRFSVATTVDELEGADRAFARWVTTTEDAGDAAEDAAEEIDPLVQAMEGLQGVSDDTGLSISEVVRNIGLLEPELVPLVAQIGAGALEAQAFTNAFSGLATAVSLDFGDAVDEFELLIEVTNKAGDEVPATVEQMIADITEQAEKFARLEAATSILEALGLDDLAAELRSQGPDAAEAAEDLVDDVERAWELENLFDAGGTLSETGLEGFREAIRQGDITPALLTLAEQFTSEQVRNEILLAAAEQGGLFVDELQRIIASLPLQLRLTPEIISIAPQVGPAGPGATGFGSGTGVGGGGVTLQQTNNFNTTPVPTTDTQRITQATSDILRHVN